MKVKELIEKLKDFDWEMYVMVPDDQIWNKEVYYVEKKIWTRYETQDVEWNILNEEEKDIEYVMIS